MQSKILCAAVGVLLSACAARGTKPAVASPDEQANANATSTKAHAHHHQGQGAAMHDEQAMQRMHEQHCPMKVDGTKVAAADVDGAAALEFETTTDVAELQRRVARMAERHASDGCPMMSHADGTASPASASPASSDHELMHSASVAAQNTDRGARLVFTPQQPEHLDALRIAVRAKAEKMSAGTCAMHAH